jgi:hypothetical protein
VRGVAIGSPTLAGTTSVLLSVLFLVGLAGLIENVVSVELDQIHGRGVWGPKRVGSPQGSAYTQRKQRDGD